MNKELIDLAIKATFENGGFSQIQGKRYMVALPNNEKVVPSNEFNKDSLIKYIKEKNNLLSDIVGIGTWLNEDKVYLDLSIGLDDLQQAIELAKSSNQLAIYDTIENIEISTI